MQAALFGLSGPITVNGADYNGVMPSMGYLADDGAGRGAKLCFCLVG